VRRYYFLNLPEKLLFKKFSNKFSILFILKISSVGFSENAIVLRNWWMTDLLTPSWLNSTFRIIPISHLHSWCKCEIGIIQNVHDGIKRSVIHQFRSTIAFSERPTDDTFIINRIENLLLIFFISKTVTARVSLNYNIYEQSSMRGFFKSCISPEISVF
jgi:hypothetical protein